VGHPADAPAGARSTPRHVGALDRAQGVHEHADAEGVGGPPPRRGVVGSGAGVGAGLGVGVGVGVGVVERSRRRPVG